MKLTKGKKPSKKYLKRKCDALVGKLCRATGHCEICGSTRELQWCHFISRSVIRLRYDDRNYACLCAKCHFRSHHDPGWFVGKWDELKGYGMSYQLSFESTLLKPITVDFYLQILVELSLKRR